MSESTIPSTPKQIAEQINREAGIHAEQVGPLQRRNARLRTLATAYRTQRDALKRALDAEASTASDDIDQLGALRLKYDAALSTIDELKKTPPVTWDNEDGTLIITRAEYNRLIGLAEFNRLDYHGKTVTVPREEWRETVEATAREHREKTRHERRCKDYQDQNQRLQADLDARAQEYWTRLDELTTELNAFKARAEGSHD